VVLHLAALGSVPRSVGDPMGSHEANVTGFLNVLIAARNAGVRRVVYASSSSVYGDDSDLPKIEGRLGRPLSPYAVTKCANELYAEVFARSYGLQTIGLRYFNVFGARQDPEGAYAAVIPRWARAILAGEPVMINGDGETSRDFCYVANAVQANLLAGTTDSREAQNRVYNVAVGARTTLNELFLMLRTALADRYHRELAAWPQYGPFREGDVRHSQADISLATRMLGYQPSHTLEQGLRETVPWYITRFAPDAAPALTASCEAT
jgi:UDP-N-acetylglucosamine 4-epimerase